MRIKADFVLLLVAVLWGSAFSAQRIAGILGSVHYFNAARFLIAGLLLLPFTPRIRPGRTQLLWSAVAGAILFVASALQQLGLRTTNAGNAGFLTSLYVVIVPIVLYLGWRQKPSGRAVIAVLLATAGAFLLSTGGQMQLQSGDILELGGAAVWALHVVLLGKVANRYEAISFSAGQILVCSALSWLAAALLERPPLPLDPRMVFSVIFTAVVSLALGYTLQVWGQKHAPPTDAALILSLESVFAAIAGGILLAERMNSYQVVGSLTILMAVVLSQSHGWIRMATESDAGPVGSRT